MIKTRPGESKKENYRLVILIEDTYKPKLKEEK
jgi:hypothetical protein